jgi:hypothetical protein
MPSQLDITVTLSGRDEGSLKHAFILTLEVKKKGQVVSKFNLLSREGASGAWDADKTFVL